MQMLVVVITVISIWFGYRVSMERSINHKPVTLLGTVAVSGMVCVCVWGGWSVKDSTHQDQHNCNGFHYGVPAVCQALAHHLSTFL